MAQKWALILSLLFAVRCGAEQFVELQTEIAVDSWDWWFFRDQSNSNRGQDNPPSIFAKSYTVHCVVGSNTWMMEGDFVSNGKVRRWFTGTNIIEHTIITGEVPEATNKRLSQNSRFAIGAPRVGERHRRVRESLDGNPGRPVRVADLMELRGKICWLAFCSGSFLKRDGSQLPLLSDLWKETALAYSRWSDTTEVFQDALGLPRSISVFATNKQSLLRYQVGQSTNVLGWNFPLEFYCVQYLPDGTNGWKVHFTAKGRLTDIGVGTKPQVPKEIEQAVGRQKTSSATP